MDIFVKGLNILISTVYALLGFTRSFKSISLPHTIIYLLLLLTNFENAYWNPPQNSLPCDWSFFTSADLLLAAEKILKELIVTGGLRYDFTESQAASCLHFQSQNRRFRVLSVLLILSPAQVGRLAGIGSGAAELSVPLPVEKRKRFVYVPHCPGGPGLDCPLVVDPTGVYFRQGVASSPKSRPHNPKMRWIIARIAPNFRQNLTAIVIVLKSS